MSNKHAKEIFRQYSGALEPWQIKLAFGRIKRFKLPPHVWDDVMQELAIIIWTFAFDPEKAQAASEETVLTRAMDNRIRMIIRCHARHQAMLGRFKEMMEMTRPEPPKPDEEAAILELHEIIAGMSLVQQEVCQSLMHGDNMHAIANDMDRAWNSIKHHVQCIREIFTDKGFDQWFE
jgi:hypothetical protein